jgi:hypothetical protein
LTINHINGNRSDNRLANLELATMSEQMIHAYRTGLQKRVKGEARGKNVAKLTDVDVRTIRSLYAKGRTQTALGVQFGVDNSAIGHIVHRRRWTHI